MELTTDQWLVISFSAFMYGFNKTGIVGSAIVCSPLLLIFFTPGQSLGIVLPLLALADIVTIVAFRHSARWTHILKAMPWAFLGIVIGWLIARFAVHMREGGDAFLRRLIAVILVFLVLFGLSLRLRPGLARRRPAAGETTAPARTWFAAGMGIFGGVTTMLANNGGPAWVVYLAALDLTVSEFLGTAAWLFFIQNLAKIPFAVSLGFINAETVHLNLYLLPALGIGLAAGFLAVKRLSKAWFDAITQGLALIGSLYLACS